MDGILSTEFLLVASCLMLLVGVMIFKSMGNKAPLKVGELIIEAFDDHLKVSTSGGRSFTVMPIGMVQILRSGSEFENHSIIQLKGLDSILDGVSSHPDVPGLWKEGYPSVDSVSLTHREGDAVMSWVRKFRRHFAPDEKECDKACRVALKSAISRFAQKHGNPEKWSIKVDNQLNPLQFIGIRNEILIVEDYQKELTMTFSVVDSIKAKRAARYGHQLAFSPELHYVIPAGNDVLAQIDYWEQLQAMRS